MFTVKYEYLLRVSHVDPLQCPTLIPPEFWGCSPGLDADVVAPRSENLKLVIRVTIFELVQSVCPRYRNVTDGRTDELTTSILR